MDLGSDESPNNLNACANPFVPHTGQRSVSLPFTFSPGSLSAAEVPHRMISSDDLSPVWLRHIQPRPGIPYRGLNPDLYNLDGPDLAEAGSRVRHKAVRISLLPISMLNVVHSHYTYFLYTHLPFSHIFPRN